MPKDTKTLGNNKARAWESLGLEHKKRGCVYFDTPSYAIIPLHFHKACFYQQGILWNSSQRCKIVSPGLG